jgi:menaquinone-dependent protoporphyrinogen oxidase
MINLNKGLLKNVKESDLAFYYYKRVKMMKTVIIFASSHGTTARAAKMLGEKLGGYVTIVDLKKTNLPEIKDYETVILGGSIHAGMMQRKVTKFIKLKEKELLTKKVGLFLCCMHEGDEANAQFELAYPEELRNYSIANGLFGGEFMFAKMNFIEKAIIKKVKGVTEDVSKLDEIAINEFATKLSASVV